MELTPEQTAIIQSTGNIRINAVAGSGKTTTLIEYARTRPQNARILYLAFNRTVKLEAARKFAEKGIRNVTVETAHSLAFKRIMSHRPYVVRPHGYKTHELADLLKLRINGEKHIEYIVATHIGKFVSCFCNSDKTAFEELDYLAVVHDKNARSFAKTFYRQIQTQAKVFWNKMETGEADITHDFYLKQFQLLQPVLPYDYILFDEGQDASPAMLDVFLKQNAIKVIVGDTHQQIYSWRYAVNSLEKVDFKTYHLSTSFRFGKDIAQLAREVLQWKNRLEETGSIRLNGAGLSSTNQTKAIIARTNLGLLLKAIETVTESEKIRHIYFEGNIHSYTYADEGASLYDVLSLYNKKYRMIKDRLIAQMRDLKELEEYIEKTEDAQLAMMVEIVKEYGNKIPGILKQIKDKHVDGHEKHKADMIFSTVHRCKGMEYDVVQLVNDFITEEKLEKFKSSAKKDQAILARMTEEINLLYVAITRTKNSIHLPDALVPAGFPVSPNIHVLVTGPVETESEEMEIEEVEQLPMPDISKKEKAYSVAALRTTYKDAYKPWNETLDLELKTLYNEGINTRDLAKHFGRTKGAIRSRIKKLVPEETG